MSPQETAPPQLGVPAEAGALSCGGAGAATAWAGSSDSRAAGGPQHRAQQPGAGGTAAAPRRRRQPALTLPEMRSKAAFRACDRLMEKGAESEAQLWSVARVMSGEEYEQTAEERCLAGKCGNPLCPQPPAPADAQQQGGRYRIRASEQAVYERPSAGEPALLYCSEACGVAVRQFAARLGSGALALDRFTEMMARLDAQQAQQAPGGAPPAAAPPAAAPAGGGGGGAGTDHSPGGICSSEALVPRLAVEQVEVMRIDSSAGQFGDFSRKPKAPAAPAAPKPKGVLKKQQPALAAGSSKVPIMLAQVKERDPSVVAAESARGLAGRSGSATAVEGYRPRAINSQHKAGERPRQRTRRVRFSADVAGGEEEEEGQAAGAAAAPCHRAGAAEAAQQAAAQPEQQAEAPQGEAQQEAAKEAQAERQAVVVCWPFEEEPLPPVAAQQQQAEAEQQQPGQQPQHEQQQQAGPAGVGAAGASSPASSAAVPAGSVLVFDVEESASGAGGSLPARFGQLRVADAGERAASAAAAPAAAGTPAGTPAGSAAAARTAASGPPSGTLHSPASGGIDIQRRGSSSSLDGLSLGRPVVPPEWREAPQFYAHSPVGSSNSLAGSVASPAGSSSNLAAYASSPPSRGTPARSSLAPASPVHSPPPGLPRPPTSLRGNGSWPTQPAQQQPPLQERQLQQPAPKQQPQPQQQPQQPQQQPPAPKEQQQEPDAAALTKRHAEQLQRAFPGLSAVLPPELEAALASDTDDSSQADTEDWMQSDDEDAELAGGSSDEDDELAPAGGRSGFRIQMSFFGMLFTHLEAWVTTETVDLLSSQPGTEAALPPPASPEVLATLARFLATALPPVLTELQVAAPRGQVERALDDLLRTLRLVGPLPPFKLAQWQVVALLLLKGLSLERCPQLRPAFETREGIGRVNRLLGRLGFTSEEFYAALELLCPVEEA